MVSRFIVCAIDVALVDVALRVLRWALLWLLLSVGACATYRSELHRGQRYYEENQYEAALALWRVLEADVDALPPKDQVRYAYLRGMTGYRLGYRADARYWLSIAWAGEQLRPTALSTDFKHRLREALEDLNQDLLAAAEEIPLAPSLPLDPADAPAPEGSSSPAWGAEPAELTPPSSPEGSWEEPRSEPASTAPDPTSSDLASPPQPSPVQPDSAPPSSAPPNSAPPTSPDSASPGTPCRWSSECSQRQMCIDGVCVEL